MKSNPLSGREFPRFSGIKTFFRLPVVDLNSDFDVGLVGVPFDGAVSYRPGARFAPSKIRESSSLGRGFHWSKALNFFEKLKVVDLGDCPTVPIDIEKTYEKIESHFLKVIDNNRRFCAIGGDHSTTLPLLRAASKKYGKIQLIHFDAHLDTYPAAWGCEYHHGAFVRHAISEGLIIPNKTFQIGIRGPLASSEDLDFVNKHGLNVITVDDIRNNGIVSLSKKINIDENLPVYISFDIDCLDPAYAPGTGTPVVGGLTTYETQQFLRSLKLPSLIGADIVEVSPPYDHSDITSLAALDTLFEILCIFAEKSD